MPDGDADANLYSGEALLTRLRTAAKAHDEQPRKRRAKGKPTKIVTWADCFRHVKAKTFKASGSAITVRAKGDPVEVVVLDKETLA